MTTTATRPTHRHISQRPGAVYRFQAAPAAVANKKAASTHGHVVLKLQAKVAELEMALAHRTAQLLQAADEAGTDSLTGLKNRRYFESALQSAGKNWARYGHKGALLMLDMNHFKQVNDTLGHGAGDALLQHVAGLLTHHTRTTDCVARLGGDEFVVLMQESSTAEAIAKTRALRTVFVENPLLWEGKSVPVSASIGVATLMEAPSAEAALALADERMYQFKRVIKG